MGCGNESASRPYTPSKQILLCAAKSLEKRKTLTRIAKHKNPKMSVRLHDCIEEEAEIHNDQHLKTDLQRLNHEALITEAKTESKVNDEKIKNSKNVEKASSDGVSTEMQTKSVDKQNANEKPPDSSDDETNEQNQNEAKKRIAPLQLMGEFLNAIMERKYSLAKKLCQMILIYEPDNPEAKQFLPLIEHKLLLDSQRGEEAEDTGEGSSDESDSSSTDHSETESESSSEDSDENA
ncbi:Glutamate-rich protein 2 [Varanus komodoensis]|nr:Glutamate-rich protein 2 [Varanus komodoensis]